MQNWPRCLYHAHHDERTYKSASDVPTDREGWTDTPDKVGNPENPKAIEWLEGKARADDDNVLPIEQNHCPIWGTFAQHTQDAPANSEEGNDYTVVISPRAGGPYRIHTRDIARITGYAARLTLEERARITTYLNRQRTTGNQDPRLTVSAMNGARTNTPSSVGERARTLLHFIAETTRNRIGERFTYWNGFRVSGSAIAHSESTTFTEVVYLLEYLKEKEHIREYVVGHGKMYAITVQGYAELETTRTTTDRKNEGFVAMWLSEELNEAYENGIRAGIKDAGFTPFRVDKTEHNDKIDDLIVAQIRKSRFVVADFTSCDEKGARGSVYFEAGFAIGLGIPVIFCCRKDWLQKVHFDTRQYNHIVWEDSKELRRRLRHRIEATIRQER